MGNAASKSAILYKDIEADFARLIARLHDP
jgi:hypothetical protein